MNKKLLIAAAFLANPEHDVLYANGKGHCYFEPVEDGLEKVERKNYADEIDTISTEQAKAIAKADALAEKAATSKGFDVDTMAEALVNAGRKAQESYNMEQKINSDPAADAADESKSKKSK